MGKQWVKKHSNMISDDEFPNFATPAEIVGDIAK